MTKITDITERFPDLNPWDRVFLADGCCAKVKVIERKASPGVLLFDVSGSWVDGSTGKALPHDDGAFFILPAREVVAHSDSLTDIDADIAEARELVVQHVARAVKHHLALRTLRGVKSARIRGQSDEQ